MLTYRSSIAVVQIAFYAPAIIGGIILASRHGFAKSSGWVLLITFSLLRLIGGVLEVVGINHPTKSIITGAIICSSIGLSPLTLMCLGLMDRVNHEIGEPIPGKISKVINLVGLIALCLGVYGGTKQASTANASDYTNVNTDSKIAVMIFTAVFLASIGIFLVLITKLPIVPDGEKRLLLAVGTCMPILAIRYIYALVADFAHNKDFNSFFGSPTLYLLMAVLTEFSVVVIVEIVGFSLRVLPKVQPLKDGDMEMRGSIPVMQRDSMSYEENVPLNDAPRSPRLLPRRQPRGPISWLLLQTRDGVQSFRKG